LKSVDSLLFKLLSINSTLFNRSVAMQPNKTKLALQIGAVVLGAACASNATADTFNLTVNTLADVTLQEVTPMTFGTSIKSDADGVCTMNAASPLLTDLNSDGTAAATNYGTLSGTGCVTGAPAGVPGVYTITGEPALEVNITVSDEVQIGNFTFSATNGCAIDYDQSTGDGDPCTPLVVGTPLPIDLPGGLDANATGFYGIGYFTLGGTITVGTGGLPSDSLQTATFLVDVVY
jgi:hypothetical protein